MAELNEQINDEVRLTFSAISSVRFSHIFCISHFQRCRRPVQRSGRAHTRGLQSRPNGNKHSNQPSLLRKLALALSQLHESRDLRLRRCSSKLTACSRSWYRTMPSSSCSPT